MHHNNHRKHKILYLKQGIISFILMVLTIYLGIVSSLTQTLFPQSVTDISHLSSESYRKEHPIIQLTCDTLYYTGYDNYLKDKVTGHYYYTIQNHYCLFVLLDVTDDSPKETITNFKGTVKLIDDTSVFHNLTQNLSKDMEWSTRSLQGISLPVIASQPDYHLIPMAVFVIGLVICLILFGYGTLSNFYYYFRYF